MEKIATSKGKDYTIYYDEIDSYLFEKYKWSIFSQGKNNYAVRGVRKGGILTNLKMHRVILNITDPLILVDHKNHNGLDNRRENLRVCNKSQNAHNGSSHKDSSSKFLGVHKEYYSGRWRAKITINKKQVYLGLYDNEEDAARAFDKAALQRDSNFVNLNFK